MIEKRSNAIAPRAATRLLENLENVTDEIIADAEAMIRSRFTGLLAV